MFTIIGVMPMMILGCGYNFLQPWKLEFQVAVNKHGLHRQYRQAHLGLIASYMDLGREAEARREAEKYKQISEFPFKYFATAWQKQVHSEKLMQATMNTIAQLKKAGLEE